MKQLFSLLALLFIGILSACSNDSNPSQEIISHYPENIKQNIEELTEDFSDSIVVPSYLPEPYRVIDFGFTSEPINDPNGRIVLTNIIYAGESSQLLLNTMYGNATFANQGSNEIVTLDNGIEANLGDFSLSWENEAGNYHELSLIVPPDGTEPEITIEELIKIANSME